MKNRVYSEGECSTTDYDTSEDDDVVIINDSPPPPLAPPLPAHSPPPRCPASSHHPPLPETRPIVIESSPPPCPISGGASPPPLPPPQPAALPKSPERVRSCPLLKRSASEMTLSSTSTRLLKRSDSSDMKDGAKKCKRLIDVFDDNTIDSMLEGSYDPHLM